MLSKTRNQLNSRTFNEFCLGGQLILWATRHWMQACRREKMIPPCVWQSFSVPGLTPIYAELCGLLKIIAFKELRAEGFNKPHAHKLSNAEICFMAILERMESGDYLGAKLEVEGIASPAVARVILEKSGRMNAFLKAADLQISCLREGTKGRNINEELTNHSRTTVH